MKILILYIYMMIEQQVIEKVKAQMDIVDVVSDYVTLKRAGQNYRAHSPFVNEKTPSFFVVPAKGIFKDFSSGKGGNAITFIMEHEGIGYIETIRLLAAKYGIEIKEHQYNASHQNEKDALMIAVGFAKDYFKRVLTGMDEGHAIGGSYFKERGISAESIHKFELGYALNDWHSLEQAALKNGFTGEILIEAGLLVKNENNKIFDRFRDRVIFPLHNLSGKIIAFGARALKNIEGQPKYLNSPESKIYHKTDELYGMYFAKNAIRKNDECFLVEGYTDVISMHQAGLENTVASSGTALTLQQVRLIRRFTDNLTIIFDGDAAGIRAAIKGINLVLAEGMKVRVVALPIGDDPDSYSRKLKSGMALYIKENKKDFISFKADLLQRDAGSDPIKRAEAIKDILDSINCVEDPIVRGVLAKSVSQLFKLDEQVIITELNKRSIRERRSEHEGNKIVEQVKDILAEDPDRPTIEDIVERQEREIIRSLFNYGTMEVEAGRRLAQIMVDELVDVDFQTPLYKSILEEYKKAILSGESIELEKFTGHPQEQVRKLATELVVNKHTLSENWKVKHHIVIAHESDDIMKLSIDTVHNLKFRVVQKMIADNIKAMQTASELEQTRLLDIHIELKQMEMALANELGRVISHV